MASIRRSWDVIVGATMMLLGLCIQLIFCGLLTIAGLGALSGRLRIEFSNWVYLAVLILVMGIVNAAAFYDFYRLHRVNNAITGTSGRIHLVPRGFQRIIRGRETPVPPQS